MVSQQLVLLDWGFAVFLSSKSYVEQAVEG